MPDPDLVATLITSFRKVSSKHDLNNALGDFCAWSGLPWYALAPVRYDRLFTVAAFTNFPTDWQRCYDGASLGRDDPILSAAAAKAGPVDWQDVMSSPTLRPAQNAVLELAALHGLREGVSMAMRMPGMHDVLVSFAGPERRRIGWSVAANAWLVAAEAYNCWLRLEHASPPLRPRPLSRRQLECLTLVAQGKSDWEAGQILGLSQQTVHAHVEAIRARYGSARRVQLVIRALFEGHLFFDDVL